MVRGFSYVLMDNVRARGHFRAKGDACPCLRVTRGSEEDRKIALVRLVRNNELRLRQKLLSSSNATSIRHQASGLGLRALSAGIEASPCLSP